MEDIREFLEYEIVNNDNYPLKIYEDITSDDLERLIELCQEELAQRASDSQD